MSAAPDPVRDIARTVLYEGYVLWPYRRDALKNQRRWTFGAVMPRAWNERGHPDDRCAMSTEVLLEVEPDTEAALEVSFRWLHVVERRVARAEKGALEFVDVLELAGEHHVAWEEATEREFALHSLVPQEGAVACREVTVPDGSESEWLEHDGRRRGAIVRSWRALDGFLSIGAARITERLFRVFVEIRNETAWTGHDREDALRSSFNSSHFMLRARGGGFVSLTDPPAELADAASSCHNAGCWPVLVGEPGSRDTMLASPIILSDHPAIAPESPGDLFDGGEIDELLVLNILGLTEEERTAMRSADPRTREILERAEALGGAEMRRLHGTFRDMR